jgi:hypothetical protein
VPEAMKPRRIEIGVRHDAVGETKALDSRAAKPVVKAA